MPFPNIRDQAAEYGLAMTDAAAVLDAANRRAEALAAGNADQLRLLMHPDLRWTTHQGQVLDREAYVSRNTNGTLRWVRQYLEQPDVVVVADTAILTALVVDTVERDGRTEEFRMPLTQTWVRKHHAWVCLAGHAGPAM